MTKWEYCVVKLPPRDDEPILNGLGENGWELVAFDGGRYILKRKVREKKGNR
jgi:hypothetical protein